MDNLNGHSEHAHQPQGQQASGLPLDGTNPALLCFLLEQHRLQLDQVLRLYNEQVRVSLQQEMSIQNLTVLTQRAVDALLEKVEEAFSLKQVLQRNQPIVAAARRVAVMIREGSLILRPPPMQQEMNSHVSCNQLDARGSGDEGSSEMRTTAETTKIDLICKVCNSGRACMMLLPCQHLCACKPCGDRLTACPFCGAVKGGAFEARFVEN